MHELMFELSDLYWADLSMNTIMAFVGVGYI